MDPNSPQVPQTRGKVPTTRAGDFTRSRKPDIGGWLSRTFELFGKAWLTYSLQGLVAVLPMLLLIGIPYGGMFATMATMDHQAPPPPEFLMWTGAVYGGLFLGMLAMFIVLPGIYHTAGKQLRGEPVEFGDLFGATDRILPSLGAGLAIMVVMVLVSIPTCGLGALFLSPLFTHAFAAVVVGREGPIQAMKRSTSMVTSHYWWYFLWALLLSFLQSAGQAACLLGLAATLSISVIAQVVAYLDANDRLDPADDEIVDVFGA